MYSRLLPTLTVLAALLAGACTGPVAMMTAEEKPTAKAAPAEAGRDWPMYGGTPSRNMVNTVARGIPTDWGNKKGGKNVKWVADLGDRGYLPPAVAGGKVYIPTNNHKPRDPKVKGDKAVLMCFDEATGEFLWQIVHDMPPAEIVTDQAKAEGLLSTPVVEGDRLYYVTPARGDLRRRLEQGGDPLAPRPDEGLQGLPALRHVLFAAGGGRPGVRGDRQRQGRRRP